MRVCSFITVCLSLTNASAMQAQQQTGVVYGIAFLSDGQPANLIGLKAYPSGAFVMAGILPSTKTDEQGHYSFENLPFGRYAVFGDDENAGYSATSRPPHLDDQVNDVEISLQHPAAELTVNLPPKAGFVRIHLINRVTGTNIKNVEVEVMSSDKPESLVFNESCAADHVILVPPDKHLLLHVNSPGFREWSESIGVGRDIYV